MAPFALDARRGVRAVQRAGGRGRAPSRVGEAEGERRGACGEEADSGAQLEDAARTWLGLGLGLGIGIGLGLGIGLGVGGALLVPLAPARLRFE